MYHKPILYKWETNGEKTECLPGWEVLVPPLTDLDRLAAYANALANWSISDYIQFELTEQAFRWIQRELSGITLKEIGRLMHEFVANGGTIDEVLETRPEWVGSYEFHWDLRFELRSKPIYIETRLNYRLPVMADESWILVVNIHAP